MSPKLWCFRWEILSIRGHWIQHVEQSKFYWASSEHWEVHRETATSRNPMEGAASSSENGKAQPIKVLPQQTSFTISCRSLLLICVKTRIKLLYLLLCLCCWGGSGTGCSHSKWRLIAQSTVTVQVYPFLISRSFCFPSRDFQNMLLPWF